MLLYSYELTLSKCAADIKVDAMAYSESVYCCLEFKVPRTMTMLDHDMEYGSGKFLTWLKIDFHAVCRKWSEPKNCRFR